MTPFYKNKIKAIAKEHGYKIRNEERADVLSDKFLAQVTQHGAMYCPCQPNRTPDTICPCKYMRVYGACRCGLYEEVKDGK
ncbi:MAG: hypothetical protein DBY32_11305 [Phascolarctobacterium sp.]|nr:MAG: hypothetical protein DBY32_11305 [Phascolarctobacterium sp.]